MSSFSFIKPQNGLWKDAKIAKVHGRILDTITNLPAEIRENKHNMELVSAFTVNGVPISNGGSLTGNVQVGTNSGFVTIDKPQFYSDPSLTIYYDFDTSYNVGKRIYRQNLRNKRQNLRNKRQNLRNKMQNLRNKRQKP